VRPQTPQEWAALGLMVIGLGAAFYFLTTTLIVRKLVSGLIFIACALILIKWANLLTLAH